MEDSVAEDVEVLTVVVVEDLTEDVVVQEVAAVVDLEAIVEVVVGLETEVDVEGSVTEDVEDLEADEDLVTAGDEEDSVGIEEKTEWTVETEDLSPTKGE